MSMLHPSVQPNVYIDTTPQLCGFRYREPEDLKHSGLQTHTWDIAAAMR